CIRKSWETYRIPPPTKLGGEEAHAEQASVCRAPQAATSWKAASAQLAMLVSFILYMPRQCLRQSFPVATQCAAASSRALYCGGCISGSSAAICAKACDDEAAAATVPASRRSKG